MKHTVEIIKFGQIVKNYTNCSKKQAIKFAKSEMNKNNQVFIVAKNGQYTFYLNPNGMYESNGIGW